MAKQPTSLDGKVPQAEVNYRPGEGPQNCAACANFIPNTSCSKVQGKISPEMLCDLYQEPIDTEELAGEIF